MSKREVDLLIDDMYQCCIKIKKYSNGLDFNSFLQDDHKILHFSVQNNH